MGVAGQADRQYRPSRESNRSEGAASNTGQQLTGWQGERAAPQARAQGGKLLGGRQTVPWGGRRSDPTRVGSGWSSGVAHLIENIGNWDATSC
jgi:hypothetical protein